MSNSSLVSYKRLSPNHSGRRTHSIDRITPHCVVGQCSIETLGNIFAPTSRQASCNYGIGTDGRVGMYVEEKNRSWCSSSNANDQRAVTIECASDTKHPYTMNSTVYAALIKLCVDICRRNGKRKLIWLGDKNKTLNYSPKSDEMVLTVHRWFANKSCPGDWLYSRLGDLAAKVTAQLGGSSLGGGNVSGLYRVRKSWSDAKSQKGAFKSLENAKRCAKANPGYSVFDANGKVVSGNFSSSTKTLDEIAREVIKGKWGNGTDRKNRLTKAGYNYSAVQKRVNELLK
ncbi:N-acetylmuramoyl-L-alanine amidase [[Clostridium] innocuum]|uniref:N-acetylmuramoyl-L-alanine amidase n=1 Tax=Clostridium innocuum TaxID=1522 RepID=UPI0032D38A7F